MSDIPDFPGFQNLLAAELTKYQPVDLTNLKPKKDIMNAKDLEKEAKVIAETLNGKSKILIQYLIVFIESDWKDRLKEIQSIQSCFVTHELLRMPQIYTFLQTVSEPLSQQLFDLRSTIIKEACKTISLISEVLENEFELQAYLIFLTEQSLFKLMESANNVMAESAHLCTLSIVYNTISGRLIKNVMKQTRSKH